MAAYYFIFLIFIVLQSVYFEYTHGLAQLSNKKELLCSVAVDLTILNVVQILYQNIKHMKHNCDWALLTYINVCKLHNVTNEELKKMFIS